MMEVWESFFGARGDEDDIRRREDETLAGIRERRHEVRMALATKNGHDAAQKRYLASLTREPDIKEALLKEAKEKTKTAKALREGEIGFLDAFGIDSRLDENH